MRNILFAIFFLSVLFSCTEVPETKFEKDGISLTCPKGWKITEEENIDEGYYLSIEKAGFGSSGLVTIIWINNRLDLSEWLNIYKDELSNNIVYKNSNLMFGENHKNEFNKVSSVAVEFTASIIGSKHEGIIQAFYGKDKTICVLKQEAIEDKSKNKNGFEMIEQSFKIE